MGKTHLSEKEMSSLVINEKLKKLGQILEDAAAMARGNLTNIAKIDNKIVVDAKNYKIIINAQGKTYVLKIKVNLSEEMTGNDNTLCIVEGYHKPVSCAFKINLINNANKLKNELFNLIVNVAEADI